jgi:topoisomerase IA-like protein
MAKYSKGAGDKVKEALHERKEGTLKSGSGKKVTSRKQAIAIGLSEAREKGEKVPSKKGSTKKAAAKKATSKKATAKKSAAKKGGSKQSGAKKASG